MATAGTPPQDSVGPQSGSEDAWSIRVETAKRNAYVMPGIAGSYYYTFVASLGRDDKRSTKYIDRADRCAVIALVLFVLAPALILFTINLPDLGLFALLLWFVYLAVLIV